MTPYRHMVMVFVLLVVGGAAPAWAQTDGEARLGGASDIGAETVVRIPQGGEIGPLHYIFVDNPEDEPIRVEFVADTPTGIAVMGEWVDMLVPAGGRAVNRFGISVGRQVAAGSYPVVVQLVRADIEGEPGRVTAIPAVQTSFVVEVSGDAGTLRADAVSAISGQPVAGTFTAAAQSAGGEYFEVARLEGSSLEAEVAPGAYRVAFLLGERILDTADVEVRPGEATEVTLEVETVSFVLTAVRPTLEDAHPVVVDLAVAISNEAELVAAGAELRVVVLHGGREVDSVVLDALEELPIGITEAAATYRPVDGWQGGTYQFRFELVTSEFTLAAPETPTLEVPPSRVPWDTRLLILLAAAAILTLLLLDRIVRAIARTFRRRRLVTVGTHRSDQSPAVDDPGRAEDGPGTSTNEPPVSGETLPSDAQPDTGDSEADHASPPGRSPTPQAVRLAPASQPLRLLSPPVPPPGDQERPDTRTDPTGGAARVAQSVRLAQRLADDGALAADWSIADAAMVYWAMTSEEVHDALISLGMDDDEYMTAISKLLHLGLLDPSSR